jgi:hypothetical protein
MSMVIVVFRIAKTAFGECVRSALCVLSFCNHCRPHYILVYDIVCPEDLTLKSLLRESRIFFSSMFFI